MRPTAEVGADDVKPTGKPEPRPAPGGLLHPARRVPNLAAEWVQRRRLFPTPNRPVPCIGVRAGILDRDDLRGEVRCPEIRTHREADIRPAFRRVSPSVG